MTDAEGDALLAAGFTAGEFLAIAEAVAFAATVAGGMEQSVHVDLDSLAVEWTPEKRAAYDAYVRRSLAEMRGENQ